MGARTINLNSLSAEDVATLVAQLKAQEEAKANEAKAKREEAKALTKEFTARVVNDLDEQVFSSGAHGYSLGGSKIVLPNGKSYRVSILIRDEATIPAKEA